MSEKESKENKEKVQGPEIPAEELAGLSTLEQSNKITRAFVLWSAGGSLIPVPLIDLAAVYAAQVTMISKMSAVYNISFSEHKFKNILWPLVGSLGVVPMGVGMLSSAIKMIPGIGHVVSALSVPVIAAAITYATGKIFTAHFEAGGTLLDFDPKKMEEYYKKLFEEGKIAAKEAAGA